MGELGSRIHLLGQSLDLTYEVLFLAHPTRKSWLGVREGIAGMAMGEPSVGGGATSAFPTGAQ